MGLIVPIAATLITMFAMVAGAAWDDIRPRPE